MPIGLVHPHAVDDLPTLFGNHVGQVVDDTRLEALHLHLKVAGCIHVHRHGLNMRSALRPEPLEERAHCFPAATFPPQHAPRIGVERYLRITMPFEQGEFIHDQPRRLRFWQFRKTPLKALAVDLPH